MTNKINFNLNKFFDKVALKKQHIKELKNKIYLLNDVKRQNYKNLSLFINKNKFSSHTIVTYIIYISFTRKNTWLHITDIFGTSKFSHSAGTVFFNTNRKKVRIPVLRSIMYFLFKKLKFLFHKPIVLHLRNIKFRRFWILKKFRTKLSVLAIKNFNSYAYNGCRKKKVRRKKFKN